MFQPTLPVALEKCIEQRGNDDPTADYLPAAIYCAVCGVLLAITLVATVFDYHLSDDAIDAKTLATLKQILLAFSLRRTLSAIFTVHSGKADSIDVFHGIKFFAMVCIIFFHSFTMANMIVYFSKYLFG